MREDESIKMIDLDKAEKEFIKYSEKFNLEDSHLKRKQLHSLRVRDLSNQIAQKMKLSDEEIQIATLIGLLHDIARFEQFTQYGTFRDRESIDHGDLGVGILKKDDYIKTYIEDEKYKDIIYVAIKNHNKYKIEEGLNPKQEMFCKIIRDADKLDIFYEAIDIFYKEKEIEEINQSIVNNKVLSKIYEKKTINRNEFTERGKLIEVLVMLAFLFDMNYSASFEIIYKQKYINRIFQRFHFENEETKHKMQQIQEFLNQYVEEKIKG